jgi:hypothetical protein
MRLSSGFWNQRVEKAIQSIGALCGEALESPAGYGSYIKDAV